MPVWDLAKQGSWQLLLAEQRIVQKRRKITAYNYEYQPIPDFFAAPKNHVLLIGAVSNSAKPHWYLGAKASQYLYVSPSSSDNLAQGVQTSETKSIRLNHLNLVKFENYNVSPYALRLEIPYWLEDIYIEVWEYQGAYYGEDEQYENTIVRLESIEEKIDAIKENMTIAPGQ